MTYHSPNDNLAASVRPDRHVITLPTGELTVEVHSSDIPLEDLCGFAARRNPKRGFLFVSKVLGKHIPVKPSVMRDVHKLLAGKIPTDLPGPVVVIGMAETAICLGHGVYEEYLAKTGRDDVIFSHSTRYRLDRPVALEFLEEHSHAADHIMYLPEDESNRELYTNARTLVLVDDEASTGKTFINLARAFYDRIPSLERVITVVITDWRGEKRTAETAAAIPVPVSSIAVLNGQYQFVPAPGLVAVAMPNVVGDNGLKDSLITSNYGRLGCRRVIERGQMRVHCDPEVDREPILVLGTGEFSYPPFLCAEALEQLGGDVFFQTTTRSPIMVGHAIGSSLSFVDNYNDGIPNYLYNVSPGQYGRVIIAHETPSGSIDPSLVSALQAETLEI